MQIQQQVQPQLQVVNLNTNEELPYWVEYLKPPKLWTKVTVDAKDSILLQVTKLDMDTDKNNPHEVFEYFSYDVNKVLEDKPVFEINDEVYGFSVVARVNKNSINTHTQINHQYILGTYELKSDYDYCNICVKGGYLAFCYNSTFDRYRKETDVIVPKDGLYRITVTEFDNVERIALVEDPNGIVCARYCESENEPEYGRWQIRVGKDLGSQMQYLYVTDVCEFLLGVKYVGVHNNSLYVKLINTDNTQITTQVALIYFNI